MPSSRWVVLALQPAFAIWLVVAVGTPSTAWADQTMSGHYIETETDPKTGQSVTDDWRFTPCGDGCASLAVLCKTFWSTTAPCINGRQSVGQVRLMNGQWTLDTINNDKCRAGTVLSDAVSSHWLWDSNTLAGTIHGTLKVPACGQPAGATVTDNIQLRQAP